MYVLMASTKVVPLKMLYFTEISPSITALFLTILQYSEWTQQKLFHSKCSISQGFQIDFSGKSPHLLLRIFQNHRDYWVRLQDSLVESYHSICHTILLLEKSYIILILAAIIRAQFQQILKYSYGIGSHCIGYQFNPFQCILSEFICIVFKFVLYTQTMAT